MQMPGRKYMATSSSKYRYGFNGKENDKDISAADQDYGMRIYDGRLGRFLSVDPLQAKYPNLTPYQFASNSPIAYIDLDGLEKYHYALTLDDQGNSIVKLISVENFSEWQWKPKWGGTSLGFQVWEKVENPRKEYIVDYKFMDVLVVGVAAAQGEVKLTRTYGSDQAALNADILDFKPNFLRHDIAKGILAGINMPGLPRASRSKGTSIPEEGSSKNATAVHGGVPEATESNTAGQTLNSGTYSDLKSKNAGTGLSADHIPSYAAVKQMREQALGRTLTAAEATALKNSTLTLSINTKLHQSTSQTYGGRNSKTKIAADAANPIKAIQDNVNAYRPALLKEGYTNAEINNAIQTLSIPYIKK